MLKLTEKTMLLIWESKREMSCKKEGVVLLAIRTMSSKCKLLMELIRHRHNWMNLMFLSLLSSRLSTTKRQIISTLKLSLMASLQEWNSNWKTFQFCANWYTLMIFYTNSLHALVSESCFQLKIHLLFRLWLMPIWFPFLFNFCIMNYLNCNLKQHGV